MVSLLKRLRPARDLPTASVSWARGAGGFLGDLGERLPDPEEEKSIPVRVWGHRVTPGDIMSI